MVRSADGSIWALRGCELLPAGEGLPARIRGYKGLLPLRKGAAYNTPTPFATFEGSCDDRGHGHGAEAVPPGTEHFPRRGQSPDLVAGPGLHPPDHHGEDGGILPPGHLVIAHGGRGAVRTLFRHCRRRCRTKP